MITAREAKETAQINDITLTDREIECLGVIDGCIQRAVEKGLFSIAINNNQNLFTSNVCMWIEAYGYKIDKSNEFYVRISWHEAK